MGALLKPSPAAWRGPATRPAEDAAPANDNRTVPASAVIAGRAAHFVFSLLAAVGFVTVAVAVFGTIR